ncbi:MAG: hypothetical protein WBY78_11210, partial [Terriglobales bacterium]
MEKKANEKFVGEVADKVVTRLDSATAHSVFEKLAAIWGSTPVWGAVGVLIGAIVAQLSLQLLFIGVAIILWLEVVRVGFFKHQVTKIIGNICIGLVIAVAFISLWRV